MRSFGINPVIAINAFPNDHDADIHEIERISAAAGVRSAVSRHVAEGGAGAAELAQAVTATSTDPTDLAVRAWLADHAQRITVCWLPTYSPHLNRIERVWRFVKGRLACHRFWNDRPGLIHLANHLFHRVQAQYADPDRPRLTLDQNSCRSA